MQTLCAIFRSSVVMIPMIVLSQSKTVPKSTFLAMWSILTPTFLGLCAVALAIDIGSKWILFGRRKVCPKRGLKDIPCMGFRDFSQGLMTYFTIMAGYEILFINVSRTDSWSVYAFLDRLLSLQELYNVWLASFNRTLVHADMTNETKFFRLIVLPGRQLSR